MSEVKEKKERKQRVSKLGSTIPKTFISPEVRERIDKIVEQNDTTISIVIRELIDAGLKAGVEVIGDDAL